MNKKIAIGGAVAGLLVFGMGSAVGASGHGAPQAPAAGAPKPAPAVTVTAEPSPAVTVTAEPVVKEVTPAVCVKYIDLSEQAFGRASEIIGYMSTALTAAGNMDLAGITQASADMKAVTPKLQALTPQVNAAKAECRAAVK